MRSCGVVSFSLALLCGCPGEPVEGSGGADAGETSGDASTSMTASNTNGSQTLGDSTDGSMSVSATGEDTGTDPTTGATTSNPEDTGPATGESTTDPSAGDTTDASTTSMSAGTEESTGSECVEQHEPNQDEVTAFDVGVVDCDDEADNGSIDVMSVADDATTPDWFRFTGTWSEKDCGNGESSPRVEVTAGAPLEICAYADCAGGEAVNCMGKQADNSPSGFPGCCGTDDVVFSLDCTSGGDEGGTVFISVSTAAAVCSDYTLHLTF